jgi:hypothetical protein
MMYIFSVCLYSFTNIYIEYIDDDTAYSMYIMQFTTAHYIYIYFTTQHNTTQQSTLNTASTLQDERYDGNI